MHETSTHQPPVSSLLRPFNRPLQIVWSLSKASRGTILRYHSYRKLLRNSAKGHYCGKGMDLAKTFTIMHLLFHWYCWYYFSGSTCPFPFPFPFLYLISTNTILNETILSYSANDLPLLIIIHSLFPQYLEFFPLPISHNSLNQSYPLTVTPQGGTLTCQDHYNPLPISSPFCWNMLQHPAFRCYSYSARWQMR